MSDVEVDVTTTDDDIAIVTLNRPERRNALSNAVLGTLHRTFDEIAGDPALRVVVVTGAGSAFCSGADMKAGGDGMTNTSGGPVATSSPACRAASRARSRARSTWRACSRRSTDSASP